MALDLTGRKYFFGVYTIIRVVDGDTVDLLIDQGFDQLRKMRFRLLGIDAPEIHSKDPNEKAAGKVAHAAFEELLKKAQKLELRSHKPLDTDGFGRWLADIYAYYPDVPDSPIIHVNQWMLDNGYAKPYVR